MAKFAISSVKHDDTLKLSECSDGYWLYDTTRGMNLAMRAPTPEKAFFESLKYYQKRLLEVEKAHKDLKGKVEAMAALFGLEEIDEERDAWCNSYR